VQQQHRDRSDQTESVLFIATEMAAESMLTFSAGLALRSQ